MHTLPRAVYYGHHKCASTWIWQIIADICRDAGWTHRLLLDPLTPYSRGPLTDHYEQVSGEDIQNYVDRHRVDFLSHIAARQEDVALLNPHRGFHVIRDPRDIIVSAYFSHRFSHPVDNVPHMAKHRERLNRVPLEEGLFLEMEYSSQELQDLAEWDYEQPHILEIKMEELVTNPYKNFLKIFDFLGLLDDDFFALMPKRIRTFLHSAFNRLARRYVFSRPLIRPMESIPGEYLLGRVYDYRFDRLAEGRKQGEENARSHYRKGVPGDWINYFTPEHVVYFKTQYNDLLLKTGYEKSPDWDLSYNRYTHATPSETS